MRSYPQNSPEAAARIVALVLIADGHVCRSEAEALQQVERELGTAPGQLAHVMQTLCEDLLLGAHSADPMHSLMDEATLRAWMAEVDDPALQRRVLRLAHKAAAADQHLAESEAMVLSAAQRQWPLADDATEVDRSETPLGVA